MMKKCRDYTADDDVVLIGTMDLIYKADRIFIQNDTDLVRDGFQHKQHIEQSRAEEVTENYDIQTHYMNDYLENSLQRVAKFGDV
eukprot:CAMPEP_0184863448 /NCGR_PEP_ID=MMETSP0580-20130426/11228_1 /TAXON_ID=1118495 /ORGANISM="Dactyliosolen fragilissimus" /LENGTH=84 /DNA_ID=CAMNT_0027361799 /DNA_START=361 /DNA_END=615 /DNA_ORIENTATION=-